MTDRQLFGVIVRAFGLYWLTYGSGYLLGCWQPVSGYSPGLYVFVGLGDMFMGVFLMFAADAIVQACYGRTDTNEYHENRDKNHGD